MNKEEFCLTLLLRERASGAARQLIPRAKGEAESFHEISAARTAAGIVPRFHKVFRFHRAGRFHVTPDQGRQRLGRGRYRTLAENRRRNLRPIKAGKADEIPRIGPAPLPGEDIIQLPAIAADDRLNLAVQAGVRPTRNPGLVLALGTFKEIGLAHTSQIQPPAGKFKPRARGPWTAQAAPAAKSAPDSRR